MKYLKIAELGADLRASRLYGIVQDDKYPLIGLLYYYIDEESTLTWAVGPETPASLKEPWAAQLTRTLKTLHGAGVIWGDVKAANVLIDKDNTAWIIDFGGGYTEGWVNRDKAGTVKGDLQGLANIMDFISDGETRTRESS
jgi:serine/threonine protein kinase